MFKSRRDRALNLESKILYILLEFDNFYNTLPQKQRLSLGFYKGVGSRLQKEIALYNRPIKLEYPSDGLLHYYKLSDKQVNDRDIDFDIGELKGKIEADINNSVDLFNSMCEIFKNTKCPKLTDNVILYRGNTYNPIIEQNFIEGKTYTFPNIISTTINRDTAETYSFDWKYNFNNYDNNKKLGYLFVLYNLHDIPYLFMPSRANLSKNSPYNNVVLKSNTYEYTLPRELQVKIEKIENGKYTTKVKNIKISAVEKLLKMLKVIMIEQLVIL